MMRHPCALSLSLLLLSTVSLSGCSVLIGNVKPTEDKSTDYRLTELSQRNPDWKKLPATRIEPQPSRDNSLSDVTYQAQSTGAVISLNSSCRADYETHPKDLKEATQALLMGTTEVSSREEMKFVLQGSDAIQTTLEGKMQNQPVKVRTLVFQHRTCLYDLIYIATPESFPQHEKDFQDFISSLSLK